MKKKLVILIIGVVIVAAGGTGLYNWLKKDTPSAMSAAIVSTAEVKKGDMTVTVSGSGTVGIIHEEALKAAKDGTVKEVLVKEGDIVEKGQTLVTFEGEDLSDEIIQQQNNLKKQKLQLESAMKQWKEQARTTSDLDSAANEIESIRLDIASIKAKIEQYQEDGQAPPALVAPFSGTITSLDIKADDDVQGNAELAQIVDYQNLQVTIQVDELDLPEVKLGMPANITVDAFPDKTFQGEVSEIANEGEASNGVALFDVKVVLKQPDGVRAGMTAEANIIVQDKKDVLYLPIEAVHERNGKHVVMMSAAVQGTAENTEGRKNESGFSGQRGVPQEISVGIHNDTMIEITEGLKEGDLVVMPAIAGNTENGASRNEFIGGPGIGGGMGVRAVRPREGGR